MKQLLFRAGLMVGKVPVPERVQVRYTVDENENGTRFYIRPVLPEGGIE